MTWDTNGELGVKTSMSEEWSQELEEQSRIPLSQFALILKLFEFSLRTWYVYSLILRGRDLYVVFHRPEAYNRENLRFLCKIFLQMCVDRIGIALILDIQKAVESCLLAMHEDHWQEDVSSISEHICKKLDDTKTQIQLLKAAKPTHSRCLYLRRLLAMTALELAQKKDINTDLEHINEESSSKEKDADDVDMEKGGQGSGTMNIESTPSSSSSFVTASSDISDVNSEQNLSQNDSNSEPKTGNGAAALAQTSETPPPSTHPPMSREPSFMCISSDHPANQSKILLRLLEIVSDRESIFQKRDIDYFDLANQVFLLDAAVGSDEDELAENSVCDATDKWMQLKYSSH